MEGGVEKQKCRNHKIDHDTFVFVTLTAIDNYAKLLMC